MLAIVIAHFVVGAMAPVVVRALGRRAFWVLALVPLATVVWAAAYTPSIRANQVTTQVVGWVPSIGLELAFSMGALQWAMTFVVAGIGALVIAYCAWYFDDGAAGLTSFATTFVMFVGAMLGLVLADDLLLLYVFWELTTVFSYLLIGHDPTKAASRQAGLQALLVTTFGGLAMLVGMLMVGAAAGTFRISEIVATPPAGPAVAVAVALLLVGALTKSALIPFHFWLPGAMAAPTPVSAYLHAASMVKAGVYLVALLAPAFAGTPGWYPVLLTLGVATMLLGGWRALRQKDIKLLLAYGTVSQLGFLVVVFAVGTRSAALAGVALLLAHALFKATLFLVVGIVDHSTGTRDLRELSGVGRAMPVVAATAGLAGLSMAGVAPLFGFVAKESVFAALLDVADSGDGTAIGPTAGWVVIVGVVLGSVLTTAYTARFLWGAFAAKPNRPPTPVTRPAVGFVAAPVLLGVLCLVVAFLGGWLTAQVDGYALGFPAGAHEATLALWHGFGLPLAFSAVTLLGGLALFARRDAFGRLQRAVAQSWSAERGYRFAMRGIDRTAIEVTGLTQRGSVTVYLAIILVVVLLVPGAALVEGLAGPIRVVAWDTPAQAVVGAIIVLGAVMTARSRRRLRAVIIVGVTGYGTAVLFLLHGAPDLALTQILVETVSLVIFVLVLRRLPQYFTARTRTSARYWRLALSGLVALAVTGFMLMATGARTAEPVSKDFPVAAVEFGGGYNIVNVTLVDIRVWDTFGEISVLVAAATGVASLIFLDSRTTGIRRVFDIPYPVAVQKQPTRPGRRVWLPGPRTLEAQRRSIIFEVVTRLLFHTIIVFSIYLLLAGHNQPGGGFAAGMVTGLALVIRYLVGGRYELNEAAPVDAGILMGTGLFVAAAAGLVPMAFGGTIFQTAIVDLEVPLLGTLHLVTSVGFDIGVYLVVVALILDLLRTFGSRIDQHIRREQREAARAQESVT